MEALAQGCNTLPDSTQLTKIAICETNDGHPELLRVTGIVWVNDDTQLEDTHESRELFSISTEG